MRLFWKRRFVHSSDTDQDGASRRAIPKRHLRVTPHSKEAVFAKMRPFYNSFRSNVGAVPECPGTMRDRALARAGVSGHDARSEGYNDCKSPPILATGGDLITPDFGNRWLLITPDLRTSGMLSRAIKRLAVVSSSNQ